MKKFLGVVCLSLLSLTGCMSDSKSYSVYDGVWPGLDLWSAAMTQNTVAMEPANIAMRLAVLLAEADKQNVTDLSALTVSGEKVQTALFGSAARVSSLDGSGDYMFTFDSNTAMPDGYYLGGGLTVKTGGVALSATTASTPWTVSMRDFKVGVRLTSGSRRIVELTDGETTICSNGMGGYIISLKNIRGHMENVSVYSDWGGTFYLQPAGGSLAYSDCHNKDFSVSGTMAGPTFNDLTGTGLIATRMAYSLSGCTMKFGGTLLVGTQTATLTGTGDYNEVYYTSPEVRITVSYNVSTNTWSRLIEYNGQEVVG